MNRLETKEFVSYNWSKFTEVMLNWFRLAGEWSCMPSYKGWEFIEIDVDNIYIMSQLLNGICNINSEIGFVSLTQDKECKVYVYTYKDNGYKVLLDIEQKKIKIKKIN